MANAASASLPVLWRTKLRSTVPGVDHSLQVQHCLDRQLIGIGWRIDTLPQGSSLDEVCAWIEQCTAEGWGRRAAQVVRRFGEEAQLGEFVWTRDTKGRYLLAKLTGDYSYDIGEAAKLVDVHQVRAVDWAPRPLNDLEVPGGVIRRFVGTGSSFSRVHDETAQRLTPYLWAKLRGEPLPVLEITPEQVLSSHLDPYDVEDLVYVWLQVARGYIALPRARQRDTPAYEYTMIHRDTMRRAIAQIKTGSTPVDLAALAEAKVDDETDTFAFASSGSYEGEDDLVTEVISPSALLEFVARHPALLPARVRACFELASPHMQGQQHRSPSLR